MADFRRFKTPWRAFAFAPFFIIHGPLCANSVQWWSAAQAAAGGLLPDSLTIVTQKLLSNLSNLLSNLSNSGRHVSLKLHLFSGPLWLKGWFAPISAQSLTGSLLEQPCCLISTATSFVHARSNLRAQTRTIKQNRAARFFQPTTSSLIFWALLPLINQPIPDCLS